MKRVNGFTLVELLTTLFVLITLLVVGISAMVSWIHQQRSTALQRSLLHSIHYARAQSIALQSTVTLCPGRDDCTTTWGERLLIFADVNGNGLLDNTDYVLKHVEVVKPLGILNWRSFRRKAYLQFNAHGTTNALNGTFTFCSDSTKHDYSFRITVGITGRLRIREPDC